MPTPGGLPRVGERFRLHSHGRNERVREGQERTSIEGTVTRRVDGALWSIEARLDGDDPRQRPHVYTECQWMIDHGYMEVLG